METIRFWLESGGITAWLIVVSGVILVVAGYDRISFLYLKYAMNADEALGVIRDQILKRDYTAALQVCNRSVAAPELAVVKAGLIAVEHGREAMKSSLGAAVLEVSRKCEKRIPILGLIAAVSTLLGLLGTISGLIKTFAALATADASEKAQMLGMGISEAMYSTAAGLGVGIAALALHTLATTKSDEIVGKAQSSGYNLISWLEESERSRPNG